MRGKLRGKPRRRRNTLRGGRKKSLQQGKSFAKIVKDERWKNPNPIWVDVGESLPWRAMGTLKYCMVRTWVNFPDLYPMALELEGWAKTAWRLKGSLMVAFLNQDLLFLEFKFLEEAKWVLEAGRKWFKGGLLKLDWWRPNFSCVDNKENVRGAWIKVVGLHLHLWRLEVLKKIGDTCGGFLAIDKETTLRVNVSWARILVKIGGTSRPSVIHILEGKRSFELQIWWELPSKSIELYPLKARKSHL